MRAKSTNSQLVARVRQGDLAAFEEIVTRHRRALVALAAARLGSRADAEDVAQEALVQAFFRLHQLRKPESLLPWLCRLTERQVLMRLRRRREQLLAPADLERLQAEATNPSGMDDDEPASALLRELPAAMRSVVALTYLGGFTCAETASLLGVREGTIKSRLSRARAVLKEKHQMAKQELKRGLPHEEFTRQTMERLMREARRHLQRGDLDGAAQRAQKVISAQIKELFESGDDPGVKIDAEAARIIGLPFKEKRRREAEANAAQYGYKLEELDWEVADVNMMSNTLSTPAGRGRDWAGIPFSKVGGLKIMDARDICRRMQCSPVTLLGWVRNGCPILRCWPFARFDLDRVRQWLADNNKKGWPKESDYDLDVPIRVIFKALHRHELTPEKAEQVITELGWGVWG